MTNNHNLTAVEWLEEELADNLKLIILNQDFRMMEKIFEKAKQMEKRQIIDTAMNCYGDALGKKFMSSQELIKYAEEYYTDVYGK